MQMARAGQYDGWGISMQHAHVFADELSELRLTAEEAGSMIRRQLTGSLAVAVAVAVFAVVMALCALD
jgi:hypothetical protein